MVTFLIWQVLIKSLRINTLSKLTHADTEAFNALIGDVFPGAEVPRYSRDTSPRYKPEIHTVRPRRVRPTPRDRLALSLSQVSDVAYEELEAAIIGVLEEQKLEHLPNQVKKILQFLPSVHS